MDKTFIEKTIEIKSTPANLWRAFTDPAITRQMGGEYITDWKPGSSLSWQGTDGNIYTHGTILEIEPARILKHNLYSPDEKENILSVITYKFEDKNGSTILYAREDLSGEMTDEDYEGASGGWGYALNLVKEKAEALEQVPGK